MNEIEVEIYFSGGELKPLLHSYLFNVSNFVGENLRKEMEKYSGGGGLTVTIEFNLKYGSVL